MTETRTERTDFLGLLALLNADGRAQGWGWPYWNQIMLDAQIAALHDAPRTGAPLLTAPAAPTLADFATGGALLASTVYEVAQTFVDEYGRETEPSTVATVTTDAGITDPAAAATLGATSQAAGFAGGLFEAWYSWTDADSRETKASPVVSISLPYVAAPLYNEVIVTLPVTPASVGAAGANVYCRHRSGNVVLASMIIVDTETEAVLTGTIANCSMPLPTVNTTGGTASIEITGAAANGTETPALTRFYIRKHDQVWTAADRRLCLASVDEWDPDTVSYPLTFSGAAGEIVAGYPPTISQVKALTPTGDVTEAELVASLGEGIPANNLSPYPNDTPDMAIYVKPGFALQTGGRRVFATDTPLAIPAADDINPRKDLIIVNAAGVIQGPTEDAALKGTPATPAVAPSLPEGALEIVTVDVPANATELDGASFDWSGRKTVDTLAYHTTDIDVHLVGDYWNADVQGLFYQTAVSDASEAHALNAVYSDTEVEGALNALGASINDILGALRTAGILTT